MKIKLDTRKIYLAMAERGITVTEIAKNGGVSQQAVSNALNGNRIGKVKVLFGTLSGGIFVKLFSGILFFLEHIRQIIFRDFGKLNNSHVCIG